MTYSQEFFKGNPDPGQDSLAPCVENVELNFANQDVKAKLHMDAYYLKSDYIDTHDYYCFLIKYSHEVLNYREDFFTVGYYTDAMHLGIQCIDPSTRIFEFGPVTIKRGQDAIKYNLMRGPTQVTVSFDTHEVGILAAPNFNKDGNSLTWSFSLPRVGWISPGIPANPGVAAKKYTCCPGFVLAVPKDKETAFSIQPYIKWVFDSPRGTVKKTHTWDEKRTFRFSKDKVSFGK